MLEESFSGLGGPEYVEISSFIVYLGHFFDIPDP